jgi:hypothetical protein
MTRRTWTELQTNLANNSTNDISPTDVREMADTFASMLNVATWQPGGSLSTPVNTWTTLALAQYGAQQSNGLSFASNVLTLRDVGYYNINYRIGGNLTAGTIKVKLQYSTDGGGVWNDLPLSQLSVAVGGADDFSVGNVYLSYVPSANLKIRAQYLTIASETWTAPEAFMTTISLPIKYEGA